MTNLARAPNQYIIGQWVEKAAWCDELVRVPGVCVELAKDFGVLAREHRVRFGPIRHEVLSGDDKRVARPRQAKHVVIVYAQVLDAKDERVIDITWVQGLRADDLARLRAATKRAFAKAKPHFGPITDAEADVIIGMKGPQVGRKMLEKKLYEIGGTMLKAANDSPIGD